MPLNHWLKKSAALEMRQFCNGVLHGSARLLPIVGRCRGLVASFPDRSSVKGRSLVGEIVLISERDALEAPEPELGFEPIANVKRVETHLQHELKQIWHDMAGRTNFARVAVKTQLPGNRERPSVVEHRETQYDQGKTGKIKGECR